MSLTEEQKQVFAGCVWKTTFHLNAEQGNTLNQYCEKLGLIKSTFTPKIYSSESQRNAGYYDGFGEPEVTYAIDGHHPATFKTIAEVADAILSKRSEG